MVTMRVLQSLGVILVLVGLAPAAAAQTKADPDLAQLADSILPQDTPKAKPAASGGRAGAAAASARAARAAAANAADAGAAASPATDASVAPDASPPADASAPEDASPGVAVATPSAADAAALDASLAAAPAASSAAPPAEPPTKPPAPIAIGPAARKARIDSGENLPLAGPAESPIAKLGVPPDVVPIAATTVTVGAMALWPFLLKTLTGLLKSVFGSFLKTRAKKGQKIDKTQKAIHVMGFVVRPAELAALLFGALIYGLGVCYAFQGRNLKPSFLVSQEALVVVIYYSRSAVRFAYERAFKITTQYKFWPGGGLLCLASAYLGNTLGTVGYELEETTAPEDADRIVKMKAWLLVISLGLAFAFAAANIVAPAKIFQSGRIMMSGMALAEILPITPMPGAKILKWSPGVWGLLCIGVAVSFILLNFIL